MQVDLVQRGKILRVLTTAVLVVLTVCSCGGRKAADLPEPSSLTLSTSDGFELAATLYKPLRPSPPALILVHMLGSKRAAWDYLARRAQQLGFMALTFDMRGHGESAAKGSYKNFTTQDWAGVLNDIDAAKKSLLENGADPQDIMLVGASIGANLALAYAVDHNDIPAVVMVSPGLDYKGVQAQPAVVAYGKRPLLLMTAEGDSYSATSCGALDKAAQGLCEVRHYSGSAHGTALFDVSDSALEQVFLWLAPIVDSKPASPNP